MENLNFKKFWKRRKNLLRKNKDKSYVLCAGSGCFMLSSPHGVSQVRLGKAKFQEPGSLALMLELQERTGVSFIAKTQNCNDDANFDEHSTYKEALKEFVRQNNIKYLIDFHGLSKSREIDINFGTHLGQNIKADEKFFDFMFGKFKKAGFRLSVDNPFEASVHTVAGSVAKELGIWTCQIEINYSLTNDENNLEKLKKIVDILTECVELKN